MVKSLRFYREGERWYADIPGWTGSKADTEMVMGADTMLNIISQGENEVWVSISDSPVNQGDMPTLTKVRDTPEDGGAEYLFRKWMGIQYNYNIWLCGVTEFVFGHLPHNIYMS